jgi:hypothetical protein
MATVEKFLAALGSKASGPAEMGRVLPLRDGARHELGR